MRSLPGRSIDETTCPALVLRDVVAGAHRALETHEHQRVLLADRVDPAFVASYVDALIPIHETMESHLERSDDPRVQAMFMPHHRRAARMRSDLELLSAVQRSVARPACVDAFATSFDDCSSARLVGRWYVFEGATNGGRFLAERIGRALDPTSPVHLVTFDPYGSEQPGYWREFRSGLDAFASDIDACATGAREAFAFHAELFDARMAEATR